MQGIASSRSTGRMPWRWLLVLGGTQVCALVGMAAVVVPSALRADAEWPAAALKCSIAAILSAAAAGIVLSRLKHEMDAQVNAERARAEEEHRTSIAVRHGLIMGLAKLADYRDTDTGTHLDRISVYSCMLAETMQQSGRPEVTDDWIECLRLASSLHDIGKVGIPDAVLLKPGKLTPSERRQIEQHALIGAETLQTVKERIGEDPLVDMGIEVAMQHHEKWDGTGYPIGLIGEEIALSARIVAVADVYDALTSKRVYKEAMTHEQAAKIIREGRGKHFDPAIVDAFESMSEQFARAGSALRQDRVDVPWAYRLAA